MNRSKLLNISKAIMTRALVNGHIALLYMSFIKDRNFFVLSAWMLFGIMLISLEGLYSFLMREGHDWKWFVK
jgi:hypothetical protein